MCTHNLFLIFCLFFFCTSLNGNGVSEYLNSKVPITVIRESLKIRRSNELKKYFQLFYYLL